MFLGIVLLSFIVIILFNLINIFICLYNVNNNVILLITLLLTLMKNTYEIVCTKIF